MAVAVLYDSYMQDVSVTWARERLAELIDTARRTGEPIRLTRRGRPAAILLDPEVFQRLVDNAEEGVDRAELALARTEDDYVPWDEVRADLGLA
jgi:antitoxin Phd